MVKVYDFVKSALAGKIFPNSPTTRLSESSIVQGHTYLKSNGGFLNIILCMCLHKPKEKNWLRTVFWLFVCFEDKEFSIEVFSGFRLPQDAFDLPLSWILTTSFSVIYTQEPRLSLISLLFGMCLLADSLHSRAHTADFFSWVLWGNQSLEELLKWSGLYLESLANTF